MIQNITYIDSFVMDHHHQNSFLATSMTTTMPNLISSFHSTTLNSMTSNNRHHFEKLDMQKPNCQSILTPIAQVIRHDGYPIISNVIQRREGRIKQIIEMVHQDLEEKQADEAEFKCLQAKVKEIKTSNTRKETVKSELMNKIAEIKKMSNVRKEEKKLDKILKKKDKLQENWDNLRKELAQYDEFQSQNGVLYLGLRTRTNDSLHGTPSSSSSSASEKEINENQIREVLISCYKIHPHFPDDVYNLYFGEFSMRPNETKIHFKLNRAEPSFPEFETIASNYNESQDFRSLINEVRERWSAEANKEGQPRVGTPGQVSTNNGLQNTQKVTPIPKSSSTVLQTTTSALPTHKTSSPFLQHLPPKTKQVLELS